MTGDDRVALLMVSVGDLSGSGGAERQFADLFEFLRERDPSRVQMVTAPAAVARLQEVGRLQRLDGVVAVPLGRPPVRKLATAWLTLALLWLMFRQRWTVVHICQPTPTYVPFAAFLSRLPRRLRPCLALTVVDCTLAHHLESGRVPDDPYERQVLAAHRGYLRWTRLDGIYTWYQAFRRVAEQLTLAPAAVIRAAVCSFSRVDRFTPGDKRRLVVYAGRFSTQKRPLLFVDAVARLAEREPSLAAEWSFAMYGAGPLEDAIRARIAQHGLGTRIMLGRAADMAPVFAGSRLFVSTQAYENFTSLAMLEAMAAGNAVIAEQVGQSSEFVKSGENGYLVEATADAFAGAMAAYLSHPERHEAMAAASRRIATEEQTIERFAADIIAFWREMCLR